METEKTMKPAAVTAAEPKATLTRLVHVVPSTSAFAGWGPRMDSSMRDVLRGMN